jgi:hypothetical protein
MQDYAKLYKRKYEVEPVKKLNLIRKIIRSGLPQTLMLAAIVAIAEVTNRK